MLRTTLGLVLGLSLACALAVQASPAGDHGENSRARQGFAAYLALKHGESLTADTAGLRVRALQQKAGLAASGLFSTPPLHFKAIGPEPIAGNGAAFGGPWPVAG